MIRFIYVVEDDEPVRLSLQGLLTLQSDVVLKLYKSGEDFLAAAPELDAGLVLLDYHMPGCNGLEVMGALRRDLPGKFVVVMLTGEGSIFLAVQMMKAGAIDFLEKPYDARLLLGVVETAFARLNEDESVGARIADARAKIEALSPRERDVLRGLVRGRPNKVIAHELSISGRTVEIYRANMMSKLGVRSLSDALRIVYMAGEQESP